VFIGLKSYEYYPLVLKDPYHDMVLGAYLSQMVYVSSVALFIAAFHLSWRAILIFTGMFVAIEFLFLALGVYKLNWWNPGYTAAGLIFYFYIAKKWYSSLVQGPSRIMRLITLFCMCQILYGNLMVYVTFAGHYQIVLGWFDGAAKDTLVGIVISISFRAAVVALICWFRRYWALPAASVLFTAGHLYLRHLGILTADYGWLSAFVLSDFIVVLCCYYADRKLLIRPQSSSPSNINLVKTR
jgi:hypothetical protein